MTTCFINQSICTRECQAYLNDLQPSCAFVLVTFSLAQYFNSLRRENAVKYPVSPPAPEVR